MNSGVLNMVSEEKARELIRQLVYKCYDSLGYGKKIDGAGCVTYIVGKNHMTYNEYIDYCIKKEFKKFGL